jgi:glutamyl-Q tRNA(Asp) synthetase
VSAPQSVAPASPVYRGRFAPSPTGPLHFGSLISAVASYCDARANAGEWIVRIEDVDRPRSRAGAGDAILATLEAYGFEWDAPVVRQSERTSLYESALAKLVDNDLAYACVCTRMQISTMPRGAGDEHVYAGTCRGAAVPIHGSAAWRAIVGNNIVGYRDRVHGWQQQQLATDVGDFVIKRSDALVAYQLAVVVDDALQGVTHVVRGCDLLDSTPRQILLQDYLGVATPAYLHHAVAIDVEGRKLSKSTHAARLPDAPLPALLAAWRFLAQRPPPREIETTRQFWRWAHAQWTPQRLSTCKAVAVDG